MAYDEKLVQRLRRALANEDVVERKMFGGLTFMVSGHMCCGVEDDEMMVRVGQDAYESSLRHSGVKPFDVTGKLMKGMVWVKAEELRSSSQLKNWIEKGLTYVRSLPPK